jgi:hypothetical protein
MNDVFEYAKNTHGKNKSGFKQELEFLDSLYNVSHI